MIPRIDVDWRIRVHRVPPRWGVLLATTLEYACVATGHWNGCRMLNGGPRPGRWHRFVNWAFAQADEMGPWRPFDGNVNTGTSA